MPVLVPLLLAWVVGVPLAVVTLAWLGARRREGLMLAPRPVAPIDLFQLHAVRTRTARPATTRRDRRPCGAARPLAREA